MIKLNFNLNTILFIVHFNENEKKIEKKNGRAIERENDMSFILYVFVNKSHHVIY
jgi:hypothetical protein